MNTSVKPFIIPVFIPHAGCSFRCIFCNQHPLTCTSDALMTAENLRERIRSFLKYKGKHRSPVQVSFYGGNFLGLKEGTIRSLLGEATAFIKNGHVDSIRFSTRPDTITDQRLEILREYPVKTVEIGVQSMDDRVLEKSRRGHSAADTIRSVTLLKRYGFEIGLQMMIGLPTDTEDTAVKSARRIAELEPDFVRIYPTIVLAGSVLAKWYQRGDYHR